MNGKVPFCSNACHQHPFIIPLRYSRIIIFDKRFTARDIWSAEKINTAVKKYLNKDCLSPKCWAPVKLRSRKPGEGGWKLFWHTLQQDDCTRHHECIYKKPTQTGMVQWNKDYDRTKTQYPSLDILPQSKNKISLFFSWSIWRKMSEQINRYKKQH